MLSLIERLTGKLNKYNVYSNASESEVIRHISLNSNAAFQRHILGDLHQQLISAKLYQELTNYAFFIKSR